jgi:flagellum-specific peptidoglycan hydrolase FlgJ
MAPGYRRIVAAAIGASLSVTGPVLTGTEPDAVAGPTSRLSAEQRAFLTTATATARTSQRRHGVPASVVIAQAVLETGWGTSDLSRSNRNYFGMTCGAAGAGPVATGCRSGPDRVCDRKGCRRTILSFRVYRSMGDSFTDHGRFLSTDERYRRAYAARGNPETFVKRMAKAGYATDPRYADRLIRIMSKYRLKRHDRR